MSTKYLAGIWGLQWFYRLIWKFSSVWLLSHVPMDYSTPGFPVHHQLLELAQTHVHWVGEAIQPSRPLSSPSLPAFNLSQHQGLFKWVSSLNQMAKDWSFSFSISPSNVYSELISFRIDCFDPLPSKELLRVFSCTTIQKHQFFSSHPSFWSNCHKHTWLLEKHSFD